MATTAIALSALGAQVAASAGLPASPALTIGYGWPSESTVMRVATGEVGPLASVYDEGVPRNTTRWHPIPAIPDSVTPPGLVATLSATVTTTTATITLSGTPKVDDCVALGSLESQAASYTATATDTLDTIAAGLAAAINAGMTAVTASASGAVVTLTAVAPVVTLSAGVANQGVRVTEFKRIDRLVRVVLWTASETMRQSYGDPIDSQLARLYADYGFQAPAGDWIRLAYSSDQYVEQEQLRDIYRRDFHATLEYGVTGQDVLYPVLSTELVASLGGLA